MHYQRQNIAQMLQSNQNGTTNEANSMIKFTSGDILHADADAIVNTVNCVGIMGRGIALQFKKAWPDNFKAYAKVCDAGQMITGKMFIFETGKLTAPHYIINFPTKRHWRGASRIEDIESGLVALVEDIKKYKIKSIAIPPLGAGLGGLDWQLVRDKIKLVMSAIPNVDVLVYEPNGAPENDVIVRNKKPPKMTVGRAILIELMQRYLAGLLDPSVSLLEVHKLLYFMQVAGQPLRLRYTKATYGPYAENLRHVLNEMEGHYILGYADGGDDPNKELQLIPGAIEEASAFLAQEPETKQRFERVSQLIEGFESSFGLELLATVHWIKTKSKITASDDIVKATYAWNEHKRQFTPRQIDLADKVLSKSQFN